jgi:hypothetical protein
MRCKVGIPDADEGLSNQTGEAGLKGEAEGSDKVSEP